MTKNDFFDLCFAGDLRPDQTEKMLDFILSFDDEVIKNAFYNSGCSLLNLACDVVEDSLFCSPLNNNLEHVYILFNPKTMQFELQDLHFESDENQEICKDFIEKMNERLSIFLN